MDTGDAAEVLETDLIQTQHRLKKLLVHLKRLDAPRPLMEEGLIYAHTLKALAAVKGAAHLEHYAAQLEQLFIAAKKLPDAAIQQYLKTNLHTIELDLEDACLWLENRQAGSGFREEPSDSISLARLVENLKTREMAEKNQVYRHHLAQLRPSEVSVEQLFRSFVPWLNQAARANQKQIHVTIEVAQPLCLPMAKATMVQTILVHLLRNALFHGIETEAHRLGQGKPAVGQVTLAAAIDGEQMIITVSDDGQGVRKAPAHHRGLAGQDTWGAVTSEPADATPVETSIYALHNGQTGLGIGLHIVENQAAALGGSFELKSIAGKGTVGVLSFPLALVRPAPDYV